MCVADGMQAGEYKGGNASKFWRDLKIMICNTKRFNDVVSIGACDSDSAGWCTVLHLEVSTVS